MLYATLSAASLALSMSPMAALSSQSRVAAPVMSGVARNPNIEKLQVRAAAAAAIRKQNKKSSMLSSQSLMSSHPHTRARHISSAP